MSCRRQRFASRLVVAIILLQKLPTAVTESIQQQEAKSSAAMGAASTLAKSHTTTTNPNREVTTTPSFLTTLEFLQDLRLKYKHQPTFLQAVEEMALSVADLLEQNPVYRRAFAIMTEPERTIAFRVPWMDDHGHIHYNRGWRVEFSRCAAAFFIEAGADVLVFSTVVSLPVTHSHNQQRPGPIQGWIAIPSQRRRGCPQVSRV